jgi:hypothetical protein
VQPFAVVIVILVLSIETGIEIINYSGRALIRIKESKQIIKLLLFGIGGGFVLLYQYWVILSDPVLSIWNQQNITESPGLLDLVISLSPCLILAVLGTLKGWKSEQGRIIVVWAAVSLILVFIPWNLQRRFLSGIYVPLAGLSVLGIEVIVKKTSIKFQTIIILLFCLILPTNFIVLLSGIRAAAGQDPQIFISSSVEDGHDWIIDHTEQDDIILANEKNGLYIPSMTGRRVVYGHPFETINADIEKDFGEKFFMGELSTETAQTQLAQKSVDYIFYEIKLAHDIADWMKDMEYPLVFSNNKVEIYMVMKP